MFWAPVGILNAHESDNCLQTSLTILVMLAECKCVECLHFASALAAIPVKH
jgi:hypothetical protein